MITKITAVGRYITPDVAECLVPKNGVQIFREENPKASKEHPQDETGTAFKVVCKGQMIGYLPELATLRRYYSDAQCEDARRRIKEWGEATKAIREQFKCDFDGNGTSQWTGRIAELLYEREGKWIEFQEYSDRAQKNEADGFELKQVAISVNGVEAF